MPRKKREKTQEETSAEGYFPVDEDDLKLTTNVPFKESKSVETIEKIGTKKDLPRVKRKYIGKNKNINNQNQVGDEDSGEGGHLAKIKNQKSSTKKSLSKTPTKKFIIPKITLKENGYELIITEKLQAAQKIATALDDSNSPTKKSLPGNVSYYEVNHDGNKLIVGCAVGHLFTLKQNSGNSYETPIFDISWTPNYLARNGKADFTKRYYDVLSKLAKSAGSLTVATDYDIEGEVIGLNVVRLIAGQEDASRMKFSTLTNIELNKAYDDKSPSLNWGQGLAGETRHFLDWFYGINLSRALMNAIKTTGGFKIMSAGRVQGPTLKLIVDKEKEIKAFKPKTFWQVFILVNDLKTRTSLELKHNQDIFEKEELKKFNKLKGKTINLSTKKTEQIIQPLEPFNLTSLQTEAYKFFGFTPSRTLQIAQSLYLAGNISYPRTSSQKLPISLNYKDILKKVVLQFNVGPSKLTREKPIEGEKSDSAHPSIHPTGEISTMNSDEEKLYGLIAKRFIALFMDDAIIDNKTVSGNIKSGEVSNREPGSRKEGIEDNSNPMSGTHEGRVGTNKNKLAGDELRFSTRGSAIRKKGWMSVYPSKMKEVDVPDMNGPAEIKNVKNEEKETQPPKRYSPASILSELEKRNLGTKATRANIIETLYDRGYIKERAIEATSLGISLIDTLEKYSPIIVDEKLTRHFEEEMESVQESKTLNLTKEKEKKIIDEAKETVTKIINEFKKSENKIGKELAEATQEAREAERETNKLMLCPKCNKGYLAITYSPRFKKHFIACNAYPDCKTTFSLPPNNTIKKVTDSNESDGLKKCEHCGFPLLMSLKARSRPWIFCFNSECKSNKERMDEYRKKKEAEENKSD